MAQKFKNQIDAQEGIKITNELYDGSNAAGTSGQVLSSTGSATQWIDSNSETAERIEVTVKNVSGGSLSKGTVVHAAPTATPPSGNVIEVIAADYDTASAMPAIGVLNETIADEAEGAAVMMGAVSGIDTDSFNIGDELYVGNAGAFINSKPTANNQLIQKMAVVIKKHASNGLIKVFGAGRSNDVPNQIDRDVNFTDNSKLTFGDSTTPDLEIYHDGSDSYIKDSGTGNLKVLTNSIEIKNAAGTKNLIVGEETTGVELYAYNNSTSSLEKVFYTQDAGSGFPSAFFEEQFYIKSGTGSGSTFGSLNYYTEGSGNERGGININGGNGTTGLRMFIGTAWIQSLPDAGAILGVVEFFPSNDPTTAIAKYQFTSGDAYFGNSSSDVDVNIKGALDVTGDVIVDTDTLFVDVSADKVGINNSAPGAMLTIGDAINANATGLEVNAGTNGGNIISRGTGYDNWFPYTNGENYYSSDTHNFRNTASSAAQLTINSGGDGVFTGSLTTEGVDGGAVIRNWQANTDYVMWGTSNMASSEYAILTDGTSTFISGGSGGSVHIKSGNNISTHQLVVSDASARFYGDLYVDNDLGVGTTDPQNPVHVDVSAASGAFISDTNIYALEISNSDTTAGNAVGMTFGHGGFHYTNFIASVRTTTGDNPAGDLVFGGRSGDAASFVERMRINKDGLIKIGSYGSGTHSGTAVRNLQVDSSGNIIETLPPSIGGSGTTNYIPKWSDANTLTDSVMYESSGDLIASGNLYIGDDASNNQGLRIESGNGTSDYGVVRFLHGGTNRNTIHAFSQYWNSGNIYNSATDSINLDGNAGVTIGPWSDIDVAFVQGSTNYFKNAIGIGQTTPTSSLHITQSTPSITLETATNANDPIITLKSDGAITGEGAQIWYDNSVGDLHIQTTYPNDAADIVFHTATGADKGTNNVRMRIGGGGGVGIGDVSANGDLQFTNNVQTRKIVLYEGADNDYQFYGFGVEDWNIYLYNLFRIR
jgi:hypothetical protein